MKRISLILLVLFQFANCWPDYYLYTRGNVEQEFELTTSNFNNSPFQRNLDTVIIIHGFASSTDADWMNTMKRELLNKIDVNVILVDWKQGAAAPNYIAAKDNAIVTGQRLNGFLKTIQINPQTIYCIGHSLGAHACGISAKGLIYKRITGLDPAGPLWKKADAFQRLDKTDAKYVDVINTDGCLGLQKSIGHKTFWPNGGSHQAGCFTDLGLCEFFAQFDSDERHKFFPLQKSFLSCSHLRSYEYYIDSLRSGCTFKSTLCSSYDDYEKGVCKCDSANNCASMGYNSTNTKTEGDFYLDTNKQEPYCEN